MIKYDKFTKIVLSFLMISFMMWFGTAIARGVIGYDIFNPEATLSLKESYPAAIKLQNVYLYATLALYSGVGYLVALISAIALSFKMRPYLKTNGWLFMALVLFFMAAPVHLYFIYMDYQLAMAVIQNGVRDFFNYAVQQYFYNRFTSVTMTTLSSLAFLANLTSMLYFVWQPLKKEISQ